MLDLQAQSVALARDGYVVLPNLLPPERADAMADALRATAREEREHPDDPGSLPGRAEEASWDAMWRGTDLPPGEAERVIQRQRRTRAENLDTPFPTEHVVDAFSGFRHYPLLRVNGQRVFNVLAKIPDFQILAEHPSVLALFEPDLGKDMVLNSIAGDILEPGGSFGGWHCDSPLHGFKEPLPDVVMATQCIWALTDMTAENGATRVVPGSHLRRRHPPKSDPRHAYPDEITLVAPRGSAILFYGSIWHSSGTNRTATDRVVVLNSYVRSWIKPMDDLATGLPREVALSFSPRLRYLAGFSARPLVRG